MQTRLCAGCGIEFEPSPNYPQYKCIPCRSADNKRYRHKNIEKVRQHQRDKSNRKRQIVYDHYKNNPCVICGESRIPCLQLDHIDPSTKKFSLGKCVNKTVEAIYEEIAKCRVVCANCHHMITAEQQGWYKNLD